MTQEDEMKCDLCGCLNLVAEGKKHPSQTVWNHMQIKFNRIKTSDKRLCEKHRLPLSFMHDYLSVEAFIEEVLTTVERYLDRLDCAKRKGEL